MTGCFVTLEGGEGVGKSTQLARVADAIRATGREVITTREPGGTPGAEAIRELLMTGATDRWGPRSEALLFAAARADHVEKLIRPAIERGAIVLCDRFIDSSRAYQGGAGGITDADILALHEIGSIGLLPDLTIVLELSTGEGSTRSMQRDGDNKDRMGSRDRSYYEMVSSTFRKISANDPNRFRVIDASGSKESVTDRIMTELRALL